MACHVFNIQPITPCWWRSAKVCYHQCVSNGVTTVLHKAADILFPFVKHTVGHHIVLVYTNNARYDSMNYNWCYQSMNSVMSRQVNWILSKVLSINYRFARVFITLELIMTTWTCTYVEKSVQWIPELPTTCWCHALGLATPPALCEVNPLVTSGFRSQMASGTELWRFLCC